MTETLEKENALIDDAEFWNQIEFEDAKRK